ncbi:hypothetical protein FRC08_008183 [Ceratobasidium sp. 394]|nr:hypothetical protein FRC08_008183 [Ceratobasidium sp. 394]
MMYEELSGNQRRVRHIQGIYVKNLTPFPIRDHASSALQHALPAPILQHSDDTDLVLARRRSRRTSQNSIVTLRTARAEAHRDESPEKHSTLETPRARTRPAGPPVSFPRAGPSGSPPAHLRRQRSTSHASLGSQASGTHSRDVPHSGLPTSPSATAGSFFHYPSQRNLEKVMSSRLVETFVTLSTLETTMSKPVRSNGGDLLKAPSSPTGDRSPVRGSPARRFPPPNKVNPSKHSYHRSEPSLRPSDVSSGQTNDSKPANGTTKTAVTTLKSKRSAANGSARTLSTSSARPVNFPPTPSPPPTRSASPARSTCVEESSIPFFISSLHRPSTNPCWTELDAGGDFAEWTDRHQSQVTATLWGRVDECSASAWSNLKGKGKETGPDETDEGDWKILVEWDIQMDKLEKVEASRAADLVFTIIGVPLSVPVAPSDPAPPLDNEEAVSAALGYAAHVVALLSAYLSVRVPYPVTYVGSRSYVRDPISAMHGPRMFPLYPTGVDTYRFEYAVFLLNKDIETLMAEQGLRAIDLRHTLPNLKNLILTLTTHNAGSTPPTIRVASIPLVAPNEDSAPTPRAASPVPSETLPTQAPAPTRSKFLSPLSAFLWSRPAATSNRPKVVVEIAEPIDDPEGATPTGTESQTPRSSESPANSSDISANSSTNEDESHEGEPKAISLPSPNGTEKLEDKVPAETPPSSPFSNTVT